VGIVKEANARWYFDATADANKHPVVIPRTESQKQASRATKKSTTVTPESYNMNDIPQTTAKHSNTNEPPQTTAKDSEVASLTGTKSGKDTIAVKAEPLKGIKKLTGNKQEIQGAQPMYSSNKHVSAADPSATLEQRRVASGTAQTKIPTSSMSKLPRSPERNISMSVPNNKLPASSLSKLPGSPERNMSMPTPPVTDVPTVNTKSNPSIQVRVECLANSTDVEKNHVSSGNLCDIEATADVSTEKEVSKRMKLVKVHSNEMRNNQLASCKASPKMSREEIVPPESPTSDPTHELTGGTLEVKPMEVTPLETCDKGLVQISRNDVRIGQQPADHDIDRSEIRVSD